MRPATVLVLIGVLFGAAPAAAQAAPAHHSAASVTLASKGRSSGGSGISKSGGYRKSRGSGYSYHGNNGSSSSGKKKMPLWQAFLVLFLFAGLAVFGIVKLVRKLRKTVTA